MPKYINKMSLMKNFLKNSWVKIFIIFASLSFALRLVFFFLAKKEIAFSATLLIKTLFCGLFFDLLALSYIAAIPLFLYTFLPSKIFNHKTFQKALKAFYFCFLAIIIFSTFSEITFWDEFQTRFNFIAVDYLIYTTEVVKNVVESYPMGKLVSAIFLIATALFFATHKKIIQQKSERFSLRLQKFSAFAAFLLLMFFAIDSSKITKISQNNYVNEISANGIYQLFSAYRNNQIDYDQLYANNDLNDATKNLRRLILKQEPRSKFANQDDIERLIARPEAGSEKKYNIIFVSIESLSADFMSSFGNKDNITPNLDALTKKSLFFTNLKATGTRTVRGLEALSLSIPPTPGNSILRRPNNENLFNISTPLKERGYDAKFLYGGFGYFDNMNYFLKITASKLLIATALLKMKFLLLMPGALPMKICLIKPLLKLISRTLQASLF